MAADEFQEDAEVYGDDVNLGGLAKKKEDKGVFEYVPAGDE